MKEMVVVRGLKALDKEFGFYNYEGIPVISSRTVHKVFDKEHFHVLRDIRELIERVEQSNERTGAFNQSNSGLINFIKSTYRDNRNREKPEYLLTKDGFTLLVMGYDDDDAMDFKLAYIRRYNEMERFINNRSIARGEYSDVTQALLDTKESIKRYDFSNEADLFNRIVLGKSAKQFREERGINHGENSIRPYLSYEELYYIALLQRLDIGLLHSGISFTERKRILVEHFERARNRNEHNNLLRSNRIILLNG